MRPRLTPVEHTPPSAFHPPFCPWADCEDHRLPARRRYRHVKNGFYRRKCDRRRIQRFKCKRCGKGFSQQTFSVTYCMKRPDLLLGVANWIASGASLRRIAAGLNGLRLGRPCHPSTIPRLARRIGSQCLLVHTELRKEAPVDSSIVSDQFSTFAGMQENALSVTTAVGAGNWLVYTFEPAWHRRSTAGSKRRPRVRPSPGELRRAVERTLDTLLGRLPEGQTLDLISDDDTSHTRAVAGHPKRHRIRHRVYRNPPQRRRGEPRDAATRARDAAMFPVDLLHKLQRAWLADHHRETLAFAKRGEALMERLAALAVFRNLIQGVSERRNDRTTPAMRAGITDRPWYWSDVLGHRRFPTRSRLSASAAQIYSRTLPDPRQIVWPAHVRRRAL